MKEQKCKDEQIKENNLLYERYKKWCEDIKKSVAEMIKQYKKEREIR